MGAKTRLMRRPFRSALPICVRAAALPMCGLLLVPMPAQVLLGHGGGLNAQGCHNNRKTGDYHCHRPPTTVPQQVLRNPNSGDAYFPNCSAARAAGRAPLRLGEPGYRPALDRDGDGVACE